MYNLFTSHRLNLPSKCCDDFIHCESDVSIRSKHVPEGMAWTACIKYCIYKFCLLHEKLIALQSRVEISVFTTADDHYFECNRKSADIGKLHTNSVIQIDVISHKYY